MFVWFHRPAGEKRARLQDFLGRRDRGSFLNALLFRLKVLGTSVLGFRVSLVCKELYIGFYQILRGTGKAHKKLGAFVK